MPKKKSCLGKTTPAAKRKKNLRANESNIEREHRLRAVREAASTSRALEPEDKRECRLQLMRETSTLSRATETEEEHERRLQSKRETSALSRATETEEEHESRLQSKRETSALSRATETEEEHERRLQSMRKTRVLNLACESNDDRTERLSEKRQSSKIHRECGLKESLFLEGFHYDATKQYHDDSDLIIGKMDRECKRCRALKFKGEPSGICCCNGKVCLPALESPPEPLFSYMSGATPESKHFLKNIRKYNCCFQMTSFGATMADQGGFKSTFRVQGQVYHNIGSLLPPEGETPKFLQIYFVGVNEEAEASIRCNHIPGVRPEVVCSIQKMLHENNILLKTFKTSLEDMPSDECTLVLNAEKRPEGEHERRFNVPQSDDMAVIITEGASNKRDVILKKRSGHLQRISETHRSYDALQYPLIFPKGEDGYDINILQSNPGSKDKKVSMKQFYAYRLMTRDSYNHILNCRYLFQQFVVDAYAKIEAERLLYIKLNQSKLRSEEYIHLRDAISKDKAADDIGKAVILPATFTGSPRQMHEYAQDAMAYVRAYGRPDLFITFTCNPNWPEISEELTGGQTSSDRHDVVARVFRQKQQKLIHALTKSCVFGEARCWLYTIEWQKRGLPHSHNLIWLREKIKPTQIDDVISAEIPNEHTDPLLWEIVKKNMIHGPCGNLNKDSPCMKEGKCTKKYPRPLIKETQTGDDGYPKYRRRDVDEGGLTVKLKVRGKDIEVDNKWIVPYSPLLSKIFNAHINVEYCNSVKAIKYICKYINKGSDMATFVLKEKQDEITQYQLGRYISTSEAVWRIFSFPIHERNPTVLHLSVHLENGQRAYFTKETAGSVASNPPKTTLTAFFHLCETDDFAKTLLYAEVPRYYTWNAGKKMFSRRKRSSHGSDEGGMVSSDALGRVYSVHPSNAECFFLRMLLNEVRGPTSFASLKTVGGHICETYREACEELGLLEDDQHLEKAMSEASLSSSPHRMRDLFAVILSLANPAKPKALWESYRDDMSEDILYGQKRILNQDIQANAEIFNKTLVLIERKCLSICGKTLPQLGLESPSMKPSLATDAEVLRERNYDPVKLRCHIESRKPLLTEEQLAAYDVILKGVNDEEGGIIFLDAPGGTGKTFLINLILAEVRVAGNIAVAVASSGVAATLIDGGRTAHSALKLPLNAGRDENPVCNISKSSGQAQVLQSCKMIVWDECTMAHKKSLEALDRTLRDIRSTDKLMGGVFLLLAGDFRQTLPVIPRSTPADEFNACLKMSSLWKFVRKITLKKNMRITGEEENFAGKLLEIGEGRFPTTNGEISFTEDFCTVVGSSQELIDHIYPNIHTNFRNQTWLRERAILAPKNDAVHELNVSIQKKIPGKMTSYKSIDTAMDDDDAVNFPPEFLNSLNPPGTPPHHLELKVRSVVMLLRNIDPPKLCNGTRLTVKRLSANIIEATILTGCGKGEDVFIPRLPLIPSDFPIHFKRIQFPVKLAFAMTVNKAQGQSIQQCGINLSEPCFSHGQLYVACSRVGSAKKLIILAPGSKTKNVVYKHVLI